ncbi:hypothetical protein V6U90_18775 [Micromonospora sp. CPCC 206060]|uniref:hypothetical protein n=1 Tax=Micromonospora sp. CPCC 206060 TaxID=3122406 RepID=UPI002FEEA53B
MADPFRPARPPAPGGRAGRLSDDMPPPDPDPPPTATPDPHAGADLTVEGSLPPELSGQQYP